MTDPGSFWVGANAFIKFAGLAGYSGIRSWRAYEDELAVLSGQIEEREENVSDYLVVPAIGGIYYSAFSVATGSVWSDAFLQGGLAGIALLGVGFVGKAIGRGLAKSHYARGKRAR